MVYCGEGPVNYSELMQTITLLQKRWFAIATLLLIIAAGAYLRLAPLSNWFEHRDRFFFDDGQVPLMVTVDSYFYLDIAHSIQKDSYDSLDERRHVPVGHRRAEVPPLLSVIVAKLGSLFGISNEWVGLLLPAVLGSLLAIPMYLVACTLAAKVKWEKTRNADMAVAARLMGLCAAVFALISPMYVERSAVGWLDTDILNVFFPVLLAYLAIRFADACETWERMAFLASFALVVLVFLWWWDQSYVPVFAFASLPLATAYVFVGVRSPKQVILPLALAILALACLGLWRGWDVFDLGRAFDSLRGTFQYISSSQGDSPFRPSGLAVSEQLSADLAVIMAKGAGWRPAFYLASAGLLLLVVLVRWHMLYIVAIALVAVLSWNGNRFLIFFAPLFGIGMGAIVLASYLMFCRKLIWGGVVLAICLFGAWGALQAMQGVERRGPRRMPVLFDAMQEIKKNTPEDAVIWASWGHGHPIVYYSQRGTVADGIYHSPELQYVLNYPLATNDFRQAANWISFYVERGPKGLRKANEILGKNENDWAEGGSRLQHLFSLGVERGGRYLTEEIGLAGEEVEEAMSLFFPGNHRPVYLFIDYLLVNQAWYELGGWDIAKGQKPERYTFFTLHNLQLTKDKRLVGRSGRLPVALDLVKGMVALGANTAPLSVLQIYDGRRVSRKKYGSASDLVADILLAARMGAVASSKVADTVLPKLFFELTYDKTYFQPVLQQVPYYSLWQVTGEKYK